MVGRSMVSACHAFSFVGLVLVTMASCGGSTNSISNDEEPDYGHLSANCDADTGEPQPSTTIDAAAAATEYILGTLVVRVAAAKYLMGDDGLSIGRLLWSAEGSGGNGGASANKKKKKRPPSRRRVCPYARLTFGGNTQRTSVCYQTTEPEWSREEQYYFDVTLPVPKLAHLSDDDNEGRPQGKSLAGENSTASTTIFDQRPDSVASGERQKSEGWSSMPPPPRPVLTISLFHSELSKDEKAKKVSKDAWSEDDDFCLGTVVLDVTQVLTGKVRSFDRWIPLGGGGDDTAGEVRIICEYDAADPPPRHGDLCRVTGFCNPKDLYPAPIAISYRVDELDGDEVILSYTSPEGWLCTFKAHRYMLICAVRHQAAIERYEAEVIEIVQKLAQSPMISVVQETAERLEDDGLINVGRDALMGGVGLLNRWLDGGVEIAVQDVIHATNWDGRHSTAMDGDNESSDDDDASDSADNVAEREAYEKEDDDAAEPLAGMPSCPITGLPMRDPVVAADGHSYERKAIMRWFKKSNMSPITREELPHKHVVPNYMLLSTLQKENNAAGGDASTGGDNASNINGDHGDRNSRKRTDEEGHDGGNDLVMNRLSLS